MKSDKLVRNHCPVFVRGSDGPKETTSLESYNQTEVKQ